jgi:hypothetical protein
MIHHIGLAATLRGACSGPTSYRLHVGLNPQAGVRGRAKLGRLTLSCSVVYGGCTDLQFSCNDRGGLSGSRRGRLKLRLLARPDERYETLPPNCDGRQGGQQPLAIHTLWARSPLGLISRRWLGTAGR